MNDATQLTKSESTAITKGRVGARHKKTPIPKDGGRYLDNYKKKFFEFKDPRINDLVRIGLANIWVQIAEKIGFDAWLDVWKILDQDNKGLKAGFRDFYRVRIPHFARYVRFQRNQMIVLLDSYDLSAKEIKKHIDDVGCESISVNQICSIIKSAKVS